MSYGSMNRRKRTLDVGGIISGTMNSTDLIPAYIDALDDLHLNRDDRFELRRIKARWNALPDSVPQLESDTPDDLLAREETYNEEMDEVLDQLENMMGEYCPPFTHFGAVDGYGASFGVWVSGIDFHGGSTDEIEVASELPRARDVKQDYCMTVTDHGNCTLWEKRQCGRGWTWKEVWSLV